MFLFISYLSGGGCCVFPPSPLSSPRCRNSYNLRSVFGPSIAISYAHCSLPDPNRDDLRSVFASGPQLRSTAPSVPCRTSTSRQNVRRDARKNVRQDVTQAKKNVRRDARKNATKNVRRGARKKISERMSQEMPESMSERMSEDMPHEDHCYIYITPRGQRLTSVQQAQNDKLRNRIAADMKAIQTDRFDHNSNIRVQFTSNREDYMHRGEHPTVSCRQGVQTYKNVSLVVSSTCVHICKHLRSHM